MGRALETEQPQQGNRGPRAGALRNATITAWAGTTLLVTLSPRQRSTQPSSSFAAACRRAGIEPVSIYELRQTAASLLIDAGASPHQVADQLGHATTRMLDQHYRHRTVDVVETAALIARRCATGS